MLNDQVKADKEGLCMKAVEELSFAMGESVADVRKRAWKTRREKYGDRGHSGSYCHPKPIYTARLNERLNSMQDTLIRLYREGALSEGQISKATGLDRVSCRDLANTAGRIGKKGFMYISHK